MLLKNGDKIEKQGMVMMMQMKQEKLHLRDSDSEQFSETEDEEGRKIRKPKSEPPEIMMMMAVKAPENQS